MILDGHIHMFGGPIDGSKLMSEMKQAGVDGGIILSLPPHSFPSDAAESKPKERLNKLFKLVKGHDTLYPFYWINPMEDGALEQVALAVEYGVAGFKVICSGFYPGDEKALKTYQAIADAGKPLLFHSGILWDGAVSSKYNRPGEFEALLDIKNLKFALAHISWPWVDENLAVYGKFLNAYSHHPDLSCEMFIDITPGTPPIYREEALTKLHTIGYSVADNILFGTDCSTGSYNINWAREWIERDNKIYEKLDVEAETVKKIYSGNLMRFLGINDAKVEKTILRPGQ